MKKEKKKSFLQKTFDKVKQVSNGIDVFTQLIYIVYLIASIYLSKGNLLANTIFLTISLLYLIYHLLTYKKWMDGDKVYRKPIKKVIKFFKKLVNIAIIIFSIIEINNNGEKDLFQILSVITMIGGFVISLIFEIKVMQLKKKIGIFKESISNKKERLFSRFKKNKKENTYD